jgi:hypothetical protein
MVGAEAASTAAVGAVSTVAVAVASMEAEAAASIPAAVSVEDRFLRQVTERRGPRLLRRIDREADSRPGQVTPTQAEASDLAAQRRDLRRPAMVSGTHLLLPAQNAEHRAEHSRRARRLVAGASPAGTIPHRLLAQCEVSQARGAKFGKIPAHGTWFPGLNRFRRCTVRLAARSSRDPAPGQARLFPGVRISPGDQRSSGIEHCREA